MLHSCILDFDWNLDTYLPLVEFTYTNSYEASIGMTLYEALYGRTYRSPLYWAQAEECVTPGLEFIKEITA